MVAVIERHGVIEVMPRWHCCRTWFWWHIWVSSSLFNQSPALRRGFKVIAWSRTRWAGSVWSHFSTGLRSNVLLIFKKLISIHFLKIWSNESIVFKFLYWGWPLPSVDRFSAFWFSAQARIWKKFDWIISHRIIECDFFTFFDTPEGNEIMSTRCVHWNAARWAAWVIHFADQSSMLNMPRSRDLRSMGVIRF